MFKLVAKLKAAYDKYDDLREGRISGIRVEQALSYMGRSTSSPDVIEFNVEFAK